MDARGCVCVCVCVCVGGGGLNKGLGRQDVGDFSITDTMVAVNCCCSLPIINPLNVAHRKRSPVGKWPGYFFTDLTGSHSPTQKILTSSLNYTVSHSPSGAKPGHIITLVKIEFSVGQGGESDQLGREGAGV